VIIIRPHVLQSYLRASTHSWCNIYLYTITLPLKCGHNYKICSIVHSKAVDVRTTSTVITPIRYLYYVCIYLVLSAAVSQYDYIEVYYVYLVISVAQIIIRLLKYRIRKKTITIPDLKRFKFDDRRAALWKNYLLRRMKNKNTTYIIRTRIGT